MGFEAVKAVVDKIMENMPAATSGLQKEVRQVSGRRVRDDTARTSRLPPLCGALRAVRLYPGGRRVGKHAWVVSRTVEPV